jgi:hypothetical protein
VSRRAAAAVAAICALSAVASYLTWTATYDYSEDAGPPIDALIHGRWHEFLAARPVMGPLSLILRAPFAALAQLTGSADAQHLYEGAYKWGIFPCLLAAGLLGLYLARRMAERGEPLVKRLVVVGLCMFGPVSLKALQYGHPEEILGAVLAAAGVLAGLRGRPWLAVAFAAAVLANKQWGLFAVLPIALTLSPRHLRTAAIALVVTAVVSIVPLALADAGSLRAFADGLSDLRGVYVLPACVWWPFLESSPHLTAAQHVMPDWLGAVARPLVVAVCLAVPLLLARRVRADLAQRALPLLALVMLLRCMLDPLDNAYYHLPFFLALIATEALTGSLLPVLVATAGLWLTSQLNNEPVAMNAFYLVWSLPMAAYLFARVSGLEWTRQLAASTTSRKLSGSGDDFSAA